MISLNEEEPRCTKPFLEHLEDLRRTVLWCAFFLFVGILVSVPLAPWVVELLKVPLRKANQDPETFLRILQVVGGFSIAMRVMFWSGVILSMPFIVFAVGAFVFPGLKKIERRVIVRAMVFAGALFAGGVLMGYFATLPVALNIMFRVNEWVGVKCEFVEFGDYISFVLKLLLAFGLVFQLPVVVLALGYMGVVTSGQLRSKRAYVIVTLLIIGMIMTPPDVFTQILMAAPMILLYELCIWLIWLKEQGRGAYRSEVG